MKNRYVLFRRGKVFYVEDRETKLQKSLATQDLGQARKIVQAKNDAIKQPMMNLVMAKTFLAAKDPKMITRTWADGAALPRANTMRSTTTFPLPACFRRQHLHRQCDCQQRHAGSDVWCQCQFTAQSGVKYGIETPPTAPQKTPGGLGKTTCKSVEQAENHEKSQN